MTATIHESKVGTYHPSNDCACGELKPCALPGAPDRLYPATYAHDAHEDGRCAGAVAWTIHDTRGTVDGGPACDECGACECSSRMLCSDGTRHKTCQPCAHCLNPPDAVDGCIGLSFAFVCLDGGDTLCESCAAKAGVTIVPCDCEDQTK